MPSRTRNQKTLSSAGGFVAGLFSRPRPTRRIPPTRPRAWLDVSTGRPVVCSNRPLADPNHLCSPLEGEMQDDRLKNARDELIELVSDPAIARYVVGYLLGSIDERYWPRVVESAIEHGKRCSALQLELIGHARRPLEHRG